MIRVAQLISDLNQNQEAELWDCLFLRLTEIDQVLECVKELARYPFMYPMVATAAFTGEQLCHARSRSADDRFLGWPSDRRNEAALSASVSSHGDRSDRVRVQLSSVPFCPP